MKYILLVFVLILILDSCRGHDETDRSKSVVVDFSDSSQVHIYTGKIEQSRPIEVAIAAITSPKETYKFYNDLLQFFSERLKRPIHIIQKKTYLEINNMLSHGQVDLAFICSGAYIAAMEAKQPIEILTIPIVNNKAYYHAYIIVNTESNISNFLELKGKTFAYTDPLSNTGYLYALIKVKGINDKPENFFSKTIFTYAHDYSIHAVERKLVDGATVNSLIFDYIKIKNPEKVSHVRIIDISEPFGIPPVVVRKDLDDKLKNQFRELFNNLRYDKKGSEILKNLLIDRYTSPDSTDYSSIIQNSGLIK